MDQTEEYLKTFYSGLTNAQKMALLANGVNNKDIYYLSEDRKLFSYFGPTNMIVGVDLGEDHECCKFGGCRMLLCRCFERYDDNQDDQDVPDISDEVEWFTGSCDQCGNIIEHKWYAVRLPLVHGGWSGCYCKWDCVRMQSDNVVLDNLVSINKANVEQIGIQDRSLNEE